MAEACLILLIIFSLTVGSFCRAPLLTYRSTPETVSKCMEKSPLGGSKVISVKSSDGVVFEMDERISFESRTMQTLMLDSLSNEGIFLANITSGTLSKVIEYYDKYFEACSTDDAEDDFKAWESEFVLVDRNLLFELILASNELQLKQLYDLTVGRLGNMILGKSVEEIREMFNITSTCNGQETRREDKLALEVM